MQSHNANQKPLFLKADDLPFVPTLQFHIKLNQALAASGFDEFLESVFRPCYADSVRVWQFLGSGLHQSTPDHATLSRTGDASW